jgi:hypothetical protein
MCNGHVKAAYKNISVEQLIANHQEKMGKA